MTQIMPIIVSKWYRWVVCVHALPRCSWYIAAGLSPYDSVAHKRNMK